MPAQGTPPAQGVLYVRVPHRVHLAIREIKDMSEMSMAAVVGALLADKLGYETPERLAVLKVVRNWKAGQR